MAKFRKRPVVVEAHQWHKNGDHPQDGDRTFVSPEDGKEYRCEGKVVRYFRRPDVDGQEECGYCDQTMRVHGWIDTLEGGHVVCPGDWVITGVKGELYPCKPDIFESTYERADQAVLYLSPSEERPRLRIDPGIFSNEEAEITSAVGTPPGMVAGSDRCGEAQ